MKVKYRARHAVLSLLNYLVKDPWYLIARARKAFIDKNNLRNRIVPVPAAQGAIVTALAGLVIDCETDECRDLIRKFRAAFGEYSRVYKKIDNEHLFTIDGGSRDSNPVPFSDIDASVLFWPSTTDLNPIVDHLLSAYLAITENGINISVISHSLETGQMIAVGEIRDHMFFTRSIAEQVFSGQLANTAFTGKILRLLPAYISVQERKLEDLVGVGIVSDADGFFKNSRIDEGSAIKFQYGELTRYAKSKPIVFVFPIFLAVGGVERNTVEIIRQLRSNFDFIIVTMERLRPEQGSLAAQAHEVAVAVIEMSEVVRHANYISMLNKLKSIYRPDLVWVCNGSPWFCDNAGKIRELFDDTPIIDQEVYDVKRGWITRYNEPGIQSFDHFIAVNKKIRERFLTDFAIDPGRVSLIYSAIDASRITQFKSSMPGNDILRGKYGLPPGKKIFTFIARLTRQKRPLMFLEIAKNRLEKEDECYVFIGDGELAADSLKFIEKSKLNNVVRIPYVENTLELHAISDGIIFTSEYEGLPIAMIEAISMGVPVFATDVGDIADVLNDFDAGAVYPVVYTAQQMLEAYDVWMSNRNVYAARLMQNEQKILDRFSSLNISRQYETCWKQLMSQYQKGAACMH